MVFHKPFLLVLFLAVATLKCSIFQQFVWTDSGLPIIIPNIFAGHTMIFQVSGTYQFVVNILAELNMTFQGSGPHQLFPNILAELNMTF